MNNLAGKIFSVSTPECFETLNGGSELQQHVCIDKYQDVLRHVTPCSLVKSIHRVDHNYGLPRTKTSQYFKTYVD
jgi:hypothetical protein